MHGGRGGGGGLTPSSQYRDVSVSVPDKPTRDIKLEASPCINMQIGWMESDFRNLTAQDEANLDNPIKSYEC